MSARTPDRSGDGPARPQPQSPQETAPSGDRMGATITAYMVTGPVLYALLGWLADRWLGTGFLLPVGMLAGMALSLYVVWLRYGKP
ncbi:AtpZ/AtpI family protein [Piscicoccus intestinalis]|uniref:AtpZ/AtpI family protein n=1 Tax=Piscicoccus intestinalis TaxID=746033 RepID=UPI00083895A4|nr:AtpZ/AtpI family protein [Piscicoccus intestinalis]